MKRNQKQRLARPLVGTAAAVIDRCLAVELTSTNLVGLDGHFQTAVYTIQFHSRHQQTLRAGCRSNLGSLPMTSGRRTSTETIKNTQTNSLVRHTQYAHYSRCSAFARTCCKTRSSHSQAAAAAAASKAVRTGHPMPPMFRVYIAIIASIM